MIDSVLKGTGNSRFLKSAVPAGTSWADALAMLQAGTFPIDFNGINTEGFQQVGTPLNKANLLKDATAAQIGLPPSTTPDGMFQALGNTGELHVWRKTVTEAQEIPAGYTLGTMETNIPIACNTREASQFQITREYGDSISVDDAGSVSIVGSTTDTTWAADSYIYNYWNGDLRGKFVRLTISGNILGYDGVLFIPSDATFSVIQSTNNASGTNCATLFVSKAQKVNAYPLTPAGTTTTYPVSTNPKAYQEGDDAKAAGYVLGDATSMKIISYVGSSGWYVRFYTADSVTVSTDGVPSIIKDNNSAPMISKSSDGSELKGKYIEYHSSYGANTELVEGTIYFVPSDAVFTKSNELLTCNKVQLVTGYAAIPAGTTIEYLGKLGDKVRVQVVSYVGTGTYGSSNPNSLTLDFAPKAIMVRDNDKGTRFLEAIYGMEFAVVEYSDGSFVSMIWNKKTVSWYSSDDSYYQMNLNGTKYYAVAIG